MSAQQRDYGDGEIDRPDWLPDEYDPNAPLAERLKLLAPIDGGIELHVSDDRVTEVVGEPRGLTENHAGSVRLKTGMGPDTFSWDWEVIVPAEGEPRLMDVDPDQEADAYQATKTEYMTGIDVRVYGVDAEAWLDTEADA